MSANSQPHTSDKPITAGASACDAEPVAQSEKLKAPDAPQAGSKPALSKRLLYLHRLAWVAILIASTALVSTGVSYVFEVYASSSRTTWARYRQLEPNSIDTAIIGTSVAKEDFDPYVLDEHMDASTFNLAFYGIDVASANESLRQVLADHTLKRVYYGLSLDSMELAPYNEGKVMFTEYKIVGEPLHQAAYDLSRVLFYPGTIGKPASFEMLFPWTVNNVEVSKKELLANFERRQKYDVVELTDGWLYDPEHIDKGFKPHFSSKFDANAHAPSVGLPAKAGSQHFTQEALREVERACAMCQEAGVELYLVVMPWAPFEVLQRGENYPTNWSQVEELATRYGAHFIDVNLIKPELLSFSDSERVDSQHLNDKGCEKFSAYFAKMVERIEAGVDIRNETFSYQSWDEYLASIDTITMLVFSSTVDAGVLSIDAHAYTGTQVELEYELQELDSASGAYTTLVPYGPSAHFELEHTGSPRTLRVCARRLGSDVEYERFCVKEL